MSILNSIQSARQRGATDDQILAEIFKQNNNEAFRASVTKAMNDRSAGDILKEIEKQNKTAKASEPGLIQSVVQGISSPFTKIIETGRDVLRSGGNIALSLGAKAVGKDEAANEFLRRADAAKTTEGDYGYFGKTQGISGMKDAVATGIEGGTTLGTLTTKVPATLLGKALLYGTTGGVGAGAKETQEGGDLASVASATKKGAITGATVPAVLGGINTLVMKPTAFLLKALGSGLSGQPSKALSSLYKGAGAAQKTKTEITKRGSDEVLLDNAKVIVSGVSKIKKEASDMFGKAIDSLKATDVDDKALKQASRDFFGQNGITINNGNIDLTGTEIVSPEIRNKFANLLLRVNESKVKTVADLRNLVSTIDTSKFKTTGSDADRIAYNQLLLGLKSSLLGSIKDPNGVLEKANAAYSRDLQLTDTIEDILGGVKFKNSSELLAISKKLDALFSQKGLSDKYLTDFFKRAGISETGFKASQAVVNIARQGLPSNAPGVSLGEATREVSSALFTPQVIQNIAIKSGLAADKLRPILEKMSPAKYQALLELFRD